MDLENPDAWSTSLETFFGYFAQFFQRSEPRENAQRYMRGLLADVKRKNSWQLAEAMGLDDPHPLQRVLNEALWSTDDVLHQLRQNCQVGVFLGYVAPTGAAFLDGQLYLPQGWCDDRERCRQAKIPDTVAFQTKPQIAQIMLERAWDEGIPMQWVTADTLYGNSPGLREAIHRANRRYVMAVGSHHRVIQRAGEPPIALHRLVQSLADPVWERLYFRLGEQGVIGYDWTRMRISMLNDEIGEQWLLIQRTLDEEPTHTFWISNAPLDIPLVDMVAVALSRHPIEELLEEAKGDVGMADYEVRHWHGWHRHMTLVMMAHTWLKLLQHDQREKKPPAHLVELQLT
jgi:SRSO17 transposase